LKFRFAVRNVFVKTLSPNVIRIIYFLLASYCQRYFYYNHLPAFLATTIVRIYTRLPYLFILSHHFPMKKTFLVGAIALLAANAASAQQLPEDKPVKAVVGLGLTVGGDKLATAQYTNGTSSDVYAGGTVQFHAGGEYRFHPEFSLQSTIGYHVSSAGGKNGDITFSRMPVELMWYFHPTDQWRVGAGARYVSNIKLKSSGVASGINEKSENVVGGVFEVEYFTSKRFGVKLRYVKETYKWERFNDVEFDGSHFGVFGNLYF
jgi:hypothetical protein